MYKATFLHRKSCLQKKRMKPKIEVLHYEPQLQASAKGKRNRVAAYCRVSTLNEEQELSFETQCAYYKKFISSDKSKILVGIYADHGISGLHMENRVELLRLIEDCKAGKIDTVMTKSVSRFSRNRQVSLPHLQHKG